MPTQLCRRAQACPLLAGWCALRPSAPPARRLLPRALRNALGAEDSALHGSAALLLRAVDRFAHAHSRFPGLLDG